MNDSPYDFARPPAQTRARPDHFRELDATELYCPNCGRAVPVNKFLLLVLPDGDRYEYRCKYCGNKVGDKVDHSGQFYGILKG
jgi:DNA-directed RNA polymerase subunit RPC12/RpoP